MHLLIITTFLCLSFFKSPEDLYGSYRAMEQGMILNLSPGDEYTLFVAEADKKSGLVTSRELSRGSFKLKGDTLLLAEQMSNNTMRLLVDTEKLQVLEGEDIKPGDAFLCYTGYYEDGDPKFEGSWRKGEKHGNWVYYDEEGNVEKTLIYKKGKLKN